MAEPPPAPAAAAAANGHAPAADNNAASVSAHLRVLITTPVTDLRQQHGGHSGVVDLLAMAVGHFKTSAGPSIPLDSTTTTGPPNAAHEEDCRIFLKILAVHGASLVDCIDTGIKLDTVAEIIKAAGCAATNLRHKRSDIAKSGIIPALVSIVTAYQRPAVSDDKKPSASSSSGGDATLSDAAGTATSSSDSSSSPCPVLSPAHPELLQCCLLAGHYRAASRLITAIPVRTVSSRNTACMAAALVLKNAAAGVGADAAAAMAPSNNISTAGGKQTGHLPGINTETYLRYFYYLGMVRIGCDDLEGAVSAFNVCLTVPCHMVSAITIAARKKMLLCRCLLSDPSHPSDMTSASDGNNDDGDDTARRARAIMRQRLLSVPAAASPAVTRYLGNASPSFSSQQGGQGQPSQLPGIGGGGGRPSASSKRSRGAAGDYYDDDVAMAPPPDERRRVSVTVDGGAGEEPSEEGAQQQQAAEATGQPDAGTAASGGGAPTADSSRRLRETNSYNLGRYDSLVDAFATHNVKEFRKVRGAMAEILAVDGNSGLAEQIEADMQSRQVHSVATVYEVVSLTTLASDIGLEGRTAEAERVVREMVATDGFSARIDQESGMVYFGEDVDDDDDDDDDGGEYRADLAGQMRQCIELADRIRSLDADITASGRYQQIAIRNEANAKAAAQSGEGPGGSKSSGPRGVADIQGTFE